MDPLFTPIVAKGGLALAQGIAGAALASRNKRPEQDVPNAQKQALSRARTMAGQTYQPGADRAQERIEQGQNTAISRVQKSSPNAATAVNAAAGINAQTQEATLDQNAQNQQMQQEAEYRLDRALFQQAGWENAAAEWNERTRFREEANAASGLLGAGIGNSIDALDDMASYQAWQSTYGRTRTPVSNVTGAGYTAMGGGGMQATARGILAPVAARKAGMYSIG